MSILFFIAILLVIAYWFFYKIDFDNTIKAIIYIVFSIIILFSATRIMIGVLSDKLDIYDCFGLNRLEKSTSNSRVDCKIKKKRNRSS